MQVVKKYLILAVLLLIYMFAVSFLLQHYFVYQMAYQNLSRLISHPSVEVQQEEYMEE